LLGMKPMCIQSNLVKTNVIAITGIHYNWDGLCTKYGFGTK